MKRPATAWRPAKDSRDRHFSTQHLTADLKGRSYRGATVTIAAQAIKFVLQLTSVVVLARLLAPSDFGLVAMVTALTGFIGMFKDAGLSMAAIQREEINHLQASALFWVNVGLSVALMLIIGSMAPAIAWFYDEPALVWVAVAIAGTFVFGGLSGQHIANLKRRMRFTALAIKDLLSLSAGIGVAIFFAILGAGYWSLVAMSAATAITSTGIAWWLTRWIPSWPRRGTGVLPLLVFGGNVSAASFLHYAGREIDKVLIGWSLGPAALGLYDRAYRLFRLPLRQMNEPLTAVAMPALSRAIHTPARYRRGFLSTVERMMILVAAMVAFAIVCSDWIIMIALGPKWIEAVGVFGILAFASLLLPLRNATGWIFLSQGRTSELLRYHLLDGPVGVLAVVAGLPWGITGVSLAVAARYYLTAPFLFWLVGRSGPVRSSDLYRAMLMPTVVFTANIFAIYTLRGLLPPGISPALGLVSLLAAVILVTATCLFSIPTGRQMIRLTMRDVTLFKPKGTSTLS